MINISNATNEPTTTAMSWQAFFSFAFRPFFLLASLFSVFSLIIWSGSLNGDINIDMYGGSLWWHMHEMLFAFVAAVIVGFLLTAVQNWTGVESLKGRPLMGLVGLWLFARVALLFTNFFPYWLIAFVDILFLPLSAIALAYPIVKVKLWKNLMFIPVLLSMGICNLLMHYGMLYQQAELVSKATTGMVLLVTLIMCIMGGRVFPMFTANGTQTSRIPALPWLEKTAIISTLVAVILSFNLNRLPAELIASVFIFSGLIHAFRVFRWKFSVTIKTPLVWSLHLSYWSIALGFILFGLAQITNYITLSQAIHTLTVGSMATMILSMISRVSLGHTGRKIAVGKIMSIAFVSIFLSFVVRVFGLYFIADYNHVISLAVALWSIAFGCFIGLYFPILTRPKV